MTRKERFAWTLLGALIVSLLLAIPVLGILFVLVAFLSGVGALLAYAFKERAPGKKDEASGKPAAAA